MYRKYYKCAKTGHYQYEYTRQSNAGNSWRDSRGGVQQQARGNVRYQAQKQQQRDDSSYSKGSSSYRGRGTGQRGRGGQQWQVRQSTDQGRMNFSTEVENRVGHEVEINICENRIEWILDSGCMDHIINDENYFIKYNKLEKPINVKIGDGRTLKATSAGNVITKFVTSDNATEVELKDVVFVKDIDRNLLTSTYKVGFSKTF